MALRQFQAFLDDVATIRLVMENDSTRTYELLTRIK